MAQKDVVVRLISPAGRSRITLPAGATFGDLKEKAKASTGVDPASQKFALDPAGKQAVDGAPSTPIAQLGITNGVQLHLLNKEAAISEQILTKKPVIVEPEKPVPKDGAAGPAPAPGAASSSSSGAASSSRAAPAAPAAGPTAISAKPGEKVDPKFETFDAFVRGRKYDTGALPGAQKYTSSQVKAGGMIKMPPSVSIKQQPYRHVDTLSVMNIPEMENFVGYWNFTLLENGMQRMGWMYGYYIEDTNYDEGTRAVVEGIYEPPQDMVGEMAMELDDPKRGMVDKVAEALGLERIGWIFTSLLLDGDLVVSSNEAVRVGRLQNEHSTDIHFTKYTLSKFVTCAVRPDTTMGGQPSLNPYMVSDQLCAIVRDGLLAEPVDQKHIIVREPKPGPPREIISEFLQEGKDTKKIATDFFVVRVNDTTPKKVRSMFVRAEFPRENRPTQPQRRDDLKKYFQKRPKSEPSWSRFADFHLLLYIAQEIDVDTAVAIGECVRDRTEVPDGVMMIMNELSQ